MLPFEIMNIKPFNVKNDEWLLTYFDAHYIINEQSKFIIDLLKKHGNINKSLPSFNKRYNSNLNIIDFQNLIKILIKRLGITLDNNDAYNLDFKKDSYIKNRIELLNSRVCGRIAKVFDPLFEIKTFYSLFISLFALNLILLFELNGLSYQDNIPQFILTILIVFPGVILHELGHVSACEKFQIKNGGVGFGRYIIFPVFYSDVTRIWSLNKRKRIIVNLAGVLLQLLYISFLLMLYLLFENDIFIVSGSLLFIDSLFQLFPFIRSDGYWVLSDYTGIYNLKKKSKDALFAFLKSPGTSKSRSTFFPVIYGLIDNGLVLFFYMF